MLALDWRIFDRDKANATLLQAGIKDMTELPISQILNDLHLGSNSTVEERFPEESVDKGKRIDISSHIHELICQGLVKDVIGTLKPCHGSRIYFPTLVSPTPRKYLAQYVEVAKRLCEEHGRLSFTVWLEDRLSVINNDWNTEIIREAVGIFRDYFTREIPICKLLVSSDISVGISVDFANTYLAKVNGRDLFSILPYRLRYPWSTRVLDVVHFTWMCYLAQKCPGIHLAGANNKRHYQIFRSKVAGKDLTVLLFKLGSEEAIVDYPSD